MLRDGFDASERRAGRVLRPRRATQRSLPEDRADEDALTQRIVEFARVHGRYGTPGTRDELLSGEIFHSLREAKMLTGRWCRHDNTERPHSAPGYRLPAPQAIRPSAACSAARRQPQMAARSAIV